MCSHSVTVRNVGDDTASPPQWPGRLGATVSPDRCHISPTGGFSPDQKLTHAFAMLATLSNPTRAMPGFRPAAQPGCEHLVPRWLA
jgi:hypothetical protein